MTATANHNTEAEVLVLGRDADGKPRAARFSARQAGLAAKAAKLMGLQVCQVQGPQWDELAPKVPTGRLYSSGKAFVPNVRRDLYGKVLAAAGMPDATNPTEPAGGSSDPPAPGLPNTWDEIDVGHLVIAQESP